MADISNVSISVGDRFNTFDELAKKYSNIRMKTMYKCGCATQGP